VQTIELIRDQAGLPASHLKFCIDQRLREKEFGILDRLTRVGMEQQYPEQAEFRRLLGKFYQLPPGGESWCDVILRLRSLLDTISLHHGGGGVMIAHQAVVLCPRYLLESLSEAEILSVDRSGDIANCSERVRQSSGALVHVSGHELIPDGQAPDPLARRGKDRIRQRWRDGRNTRLTHATQRLVILV
jgi:broad specificity phosphatase PhoE